MFSLKHSHKNVVLEELRHVICSSFMFSVIIFYGAAVSAILALLPYIK